MMRDEVFGQVVNRLVFEKQRLGQRTKSVLQLVGQLHRQNGVDAVVFQRRARINLVRRQFQEFRKLPPQIVLRLLLETPGIDPDSDHRLLRLQFGRQCSAGKPRRKSVHLHTDVPSLLT